jgi:hypothetical protein
MEQVGSNVVANGSGTIDLTGLTLLVAGVTDSPYLEPDFEHIVIGYNDGSHNIGSAIVTYYIGASGPGNFGSGTGTWPSGGLGSVVGFRGTLTVVPFGYVSGTGLGGSMFFSNATFASLGVTPGIYEWTWGTGAHTDYFELEIGVPESGSTLGLFLVSLIALVGLGSAIGLTNLKPTNKKL